MVHIHFALKNANIVLYNEYNREIYVAVMLYGKGTIDTLKLYRLSKISLTSN